MNQAPVTPGSADLEQRPYFRKKSVGRRILAAIVVLALLALIAMDGTRSMGRYVPFFVERNVAANYLLELPAQDAYAEALNAFTEKIAAVQGLPPGIAVEVHVIPQDTIQAFATLGGHILVYKGLLRAIRSEDELTALMAHQVAHLAERHPAQALGRRVSVGMMLSLFSQDWAEELARPSFHASLRTAPAFLDEHEVATQLATGQTLFSMYGHLGGAVDLARTLRRLVGEQADNFPRILETHPDILQLDDSLRRISQEHDWPLDDKAGRRRPLSAALVIDSPKPANSTAVPAAAEPTLPASASPVPAAPAEAPLPSVAAPQQSAPAQR